MTTTTSTTQKIQLAIKASPEQIWAALTDGKITPAYYVGFRAEFDLTAGAPYRYAAGGATSSPAPSWRSSRVGG